MQSLNLTKGGRLDITKNTGVNKILVALGWNEGKYDLDVSLLMLQGGKIVTTDDVVFYNMIRNADNKLTHKSGSVSHSGDNLTGAGLNNTDKEVLTIDLAKVPTSYERLIVIITMYEDPKKPPTHQNFGLVKSSYVRIVDAVSNQQMGRYDLSEDYSLFNAVIIGAVYRRDTEWKFEAIGNGTTGDINTVAQTYS